MGSRRQGRPYITHEAKPRAPISARTARRVPSGGYASSDGSGVRNLGAPGPASTIALPRSSSEDNRRIVEMDLWDLGDYELIGLRLVDFRANRTGQLRRKAVEAYVSWNPPGGHESSSDSRRFDRWSGTRRSARCQRPM